MKAKQSSRPADPAVEDRERGAVAREVAQRPPRERRGLRPQTHGPPDDYEALAAALADAITDEADAFSVSRRFCRRHGISVQMYYKLANWQDLACRRRSTSERACWCPKKPQPLGGARVRPQALQTRRDDQAGPHL